MGEQLNEYDRFRLGRLQQYEEEDKLSAHFSHKESLPGYSDRVDIVSNRSTPEQLTESLHLELLKERKSKATLAQEMQEVRKKYEALQMKYEKTVEELSKEQQDNSRLRAQIAEKEEQERATRAKLKRWVHEAKHNLTY